MRMVCLVFGLAIGFLPSAYAWKRSISTDKMTDEKVVAFSQFSKQPTWARSKSELTLLYNCTKNETFVMISHPWIIKGDYVDMRIDKGEAFKVNASGSRKTFIIGMSKRGTEVDTLIGQLRDGKNLVVRYSEAGGKLVDAEFDLQGLKSKIVDPCKGAKVSLRNNIQLHIGTILR